MSALDKILEQIKTLELEINKESESLDEKIDKLGLLKKTVTMACEIAEEEKAKEQEAFLTLVCQFEAGSATRSDFLTYATDRELDHPEAPPDKEGEAKAA